MTDEDLDFGTPEEQTNRALADVAETRAEQRADGFTAEYDDAQTFEARMEVLDKWVDRLRHAPEGDRRGVLRVLSSVSVAFYEGEIRAHLRDRALSEAAVKEHAGA